MLLEPPKNPESLGPRKIVRSPSKPQEWYAWHFPELTRIVTDNIAYAKVSKVIRVPWMNAVAATARGEIRGVKGLGLDGLGQGEDNLTCGPFVHLQR